MPQYRPRNVTNVIRRRKLSTADRGKRLRTQQQCHTSAWTGAVKHRRVRASASNYIYDVVLHALFHRYVADKRPAPRDRIGIRQRAYINTVQSASVKARAPVSEHFMIGFDRWI